MGLRFGEGKGFLHPIVLQLGFRVLGFSLFFFRVLGFRVLGLQGNVECIAACEVLPWPNCRRPSNTFTHPTPFEAAKPPRPTPFKVEDVHPGQAVDSAAAFEGFTVGLEGWAPLKLAAP